MRSKVPDGPVLAGWLPVGRPASPGFIIGGKHGLRFYTPGHPVVRRDAVAEVWASERRPREIVRGGELTMGRIYFDDAPDPVAADQAAIAAGVAEAYSVIGTAQEQARLFFVQNGVDVVSGHQPVTASAQMGDVDARPDAADSGG